MPGGDRTGPGGMGPMTGRGAGYCAGYAVPGFMNPAGGRGYWGGGRGGGGWGRRNQFYATGLTGWQRAAYGYGGPVGAVPYAGAGGAPFTQAMAPEQEVEMLKAQAEYFDDALGGIKKRIEELESKAKEK